MLSTSLPTQNGKHDFVADKQEVRTYLVGSTAPMLDNKRVSAQGQFFGHGSNREVGTQDIRKPRGYVT